MSFTGPDFQPINRTLFSTDSMYSFDRLAESIASRASRTIRPLLGSRIATEYAGVHENRSLTCASMWYVRTIGFMRYRVISWLP
jgi:hypothetical protein